VTAEPAWLDRARRLAAQAQNGLLYAASDFDVLRWTEVRRIAAELMAEGAGTDADAVEGLLAREQGYATPKVDVRALLVRDGRVLLVKELADGRWSLPGGWADPGDRPSAAAEREVREEAGYVARATRLLACWDRSLMRGAPPYPFRIYKLVFDCEVLGETARDDTETDDVGWFAPDALPPLSPGRTHADQIARLLTVHTDPSAPALFD
jgi:ADP-ribose pyrophosphatase YjhB (NUDIX family)